MLVCICRRVSDRDIAREVRNGCSHFEELQFELGVATGCGRCEDCARAIFYECGREPGPRSIPISVRAAMTSA